MMPFVGEYRHNIDTKGRLIIPAKFRNNFSERVYLSKGFETCLLILTPEEIEKIEKRITESSLTNKAVRKFSRAFFSGMTEAAFDGQGRILIPSNLREYGGIQGETVVVGTGFYVEIWDKDAWELGTSQLDEERFNIADFLEGLDG